MKNVILILLFICPISIFSQENSYLFTNNNALKISVFEFGKAEFQLSYERFFNDRKSSLSIIPSIILENDNETNKEGWSIMSQYRFYLTHFNKQHTNTFLGFENYALYTGLYGSYLDYVEDYSIMDWNESQQDYTTEEHRKDLSAVEAGALIGMQINFSKRVLLDIYIGGGIKKTDLNDSYDGDEYSYYNSYSVFDREYEGVKPRLGFQLGFNF